MSVAIEKPIVNNRQSLFVGKLVGAVRTQSIPDDQRDFDQGPHECLQDSKTASADV